MIRQKLSDLKPGMQLARPVRTQQDLLLLDAETTLSDKHIRLFKSWGVPHVFIHGHTAGEAEHQAVPAKEQQAAITRVLHNKFRNVLTDPVMVEIMTAAQRQLFKSVQDQVT
jgi:hypothetical protein